MAWSFATRPGRVPGRPGQGVSAAGNPIWSASAGRERSRLSSSRGLVFDLAVERERRDIPRDGGIAGTGPVGELGAGPNGWRSEPAAMAETGIGSVFELATTRQQSLICCAPARRLCHLPGSGHKAENHRAGPSSRFGLGKFCEELLDGPLPVQLGGQCAAQCIGAGESADTPRQ